VGEGRKSLEPKKLTKAEAGRLGGLIGGRISIGGGRPKKYHTESERRAAAVKRQQAYRERDILAVRLYKGMKV
jgi:hypothetical protein